MARVRKTFAEDLIKPIRAEAYSHFWDCAAARAAETAGAHSSEPIEADFALVYKGCIHIAVGEYGDLLTQFAIARRKRITGDIRSYIMGEALRFSSQLSEWGTSGGFLAIAMGKTAPYKQEISVGVRDAFLNNLERSLGEWQAEADRKIALRCLLSAAPSRSLLRQDLTKAMIARLKADDPGVSQRRICAKLDALKTPLPLPPTWRRYEERSWVSAYDRPELKNRVKKFISEIKPGPRTKSPLSRVTGVTEDRM